MPRLSTRLAALSLCATATASMVTSADAQTRRPMTFDDFAAVRAVSDPQLSPNGASVLYGVRTTNVSDNRRSGATFLIPVAGGTPKQFPSASVAAGEARWSPDGKWVAYVADGQLWLADAAGGNTKQLTTLHGGASGLVWAPTGDRIAFVSSVYPECADDACNVAKSKAKSDSKLKAIVTDQLMFRHWNTYDQGTRSHLFVVSTDGSGLRDLTPGAKYDVPPAPFGGSEGYTFSPDGKEMSYTAKDQGQAEAWTTDVNVYLVPVTGGAPTIITTSNKGADQDAVYSPDGKYLIYHSQERGGFESDQWRLMLYDRTAKTTTRLAAAWNRNADAYFFAPDSKTIYIQSADASRFKLFALTRTGDAWAAVPTLVIGEKNNIAYSLSKDGKTIAWMRDAIEVPGEVYVASLNNGQLSNERQLTHENDALVAQLQLYPGEEFWFKGAQGDSVQGFVIKPPQYQAGQKFPVVLIIHGGPQVPFLDQWHQRWNFSLFASGGYGVVFINPRGSPGYGQKFVDQVSKDWGGAAYQDLMLGLDAAIANNSSWMDSNRQGAAGASFGGYMINWINGHTNRFKGLVNHDGVFNLENMYGATEELWFTEWEFGGPYWDKKAMDTQYRVWSPHLFAGSMRTPTLIVHGELDYRVPIDEGISAFSALQRQNVPSRLIIFPDEGHWVTKPQNQQLWYGEIFAWFNKYLK